MLAPSPGTVPGDNLIRRERQWADDSDELSGPNSNMPLPGFQTQVAKYKGELNDC